MKNTLSSLSKKRGAALLIVVFFFIAISLAIIQSATIGALSELRTYRSLATSKFAYVAAEAGIEDVFYRIITERNVPVSQTIGLNGATSTISAVPISASQWDIYATGNASNEVRKLYLSTSKNQNASFPYGAQVGEGGIVMGNNVIVDGIGLANGDIYANGQVVGSANVEVRGNITVSSRLNVDTIASSTECSVDEVVGQTNPKIDHAQSFVMASSSTDVLVKVALYLRRNSNPSAATVHIVADNAGAPATTPLASQSLGYTSVGTSFGWVDVVFVAPAFLNPGSTYWIVLDSGQSNSKYWHWCRSAGDAYASGAGAHKEDWSTAGAWTTLPGDLAFQLYYGGGTSMLSGVPSVTGIAKADTINNTNIAGDAYYQTISGSTVGGISYPASPTPPPVPLPFTPTTITQWKADAASGGTINGNCGSGGHPSCNTYPLTIGPRQINGNLVLNIGEALTVSGTLYVTGNIDLSNNSSMRCHPSFGTNSCLVIADGYIRISNNGTLGGSGTAGSFIMLLTTKQGCLGAGTVIAGCTTNNSALSVENNVDSALLYAGESMIDVSNNAIVTAIIAYKLSMQNNTTINYDGAVVNSVFSASATSTTGAWSANRWNEF